MTDTAAPPELKIAICTPYYGSITPEYTFSLAKLLQRMADVKIEFNGVVVSPVIELFMRSSSVLPQLRNMLVKDALEWNANYLLWLDSDQKFPDEALLRLLSINRPVVGTNYPRRVAPHDPTATGLDGRLIVTPAHVDPDDALVACSSMGLGCCLIDMTVFDRVRRHAVANGATDMWPLFAIEMVGDGTQIVGEDVFFFRKLRDAGVELWIDQPLSWTIGHVHQKVLTHADAAAAKAPTPAPNPAPPPPVAPRVRFGKPH